MDYFAGTTGLDLHAVFAYLTALTGLDVECLDYGIFGYKKVYRIGFIRIAENPDRPDMRIFIEIKGEGCSWLGLERLAMIFYGLGIKVTRLDPCIDHCPFTPQQLLEEWQRGNVNTPIRFPQNARPGRENVRTHRWFSSPEGDTLYMGSSESSQMIRCYDKRGYTRLELQTRKQRAHKAAELLFAEIDKGDREAFAAVALGLLRGVVDFVDSSADSNASRAPLLSWWAAFVEGVKKVRTTLDGKPAQTLERIQQWLESGVSAMLATYARCGGSVGELLKLGRTRMGQRHRAVVKMHGGFLSTV